jgi:glc operon protein GlcG
MRYLVQMAFAACITAAITAQAQTAAPPPASAVPEQMPFDIPYGTPIVIDAAKHLLAVAEAEAKRHDWKMNIAVVDTHGDLVTFERMDGAQYASIGVSQRKARTAARFRRETRVFYNQYASGQTYVGTLDPDLVASPGGFPLVERGKLIGAIGCSGGTAEQDAVVCKAAADTVK